MHHGDYLIRNCAFPYIEVLFTKFRLLMWSNRTPIPETLVQCENNSDEYNNTDELRGRFYKWYHLYKEWRLFRVVVVGNSAGRPARRRKRTSRLECGDDRTFRHMLTFSLAYARDVVAILDRRLVGGVENIAQPFINVNAAWTILIVATVLNTR